MTGMLHWNRANFKAVDDLLVVDVPMTAAEEDRRIEAMLDLIAEATASRFGTTYELLAIRADGGRNYTVRYTVTPKAEA